MYILFINQPIWVLIINIYYLSNFIEIYNKIFKIIITNWIYLLIYTYIHISTVLLTIDQILSMRSFESSVVFGCIWMYRGRSFRKNKHT